MDNCTMDPWIDPWIHGLNDLELGAPTVSLIQFKFPLRRSAYRVRVRCIATSDAHIAAVMLLIVINIVFYYC